MSGSRDSKPARRVPFPPERRLVLDTLRLGQDKPMMHGLLELDVTRARRMLREHRAASGESISFTAFLLACLGRSVAAHPAVHALRDWRGRLVMFDDVDATVIIEVEVEGRVFPLAHVMRGIERRSVRDLHDEIRAVQASGLRSVGRGARRGVRALALVPGPVRRLAYRGLLRLPALAKQHTGTLLVTAVGMFGGDQAAWGMSAPGIHDLSVLVGGIVTRAPATAGDPPREHLCLTVSANHALVDGAPLARFVRDLSQRVEAAEGLAGDGLAPAR